jgi:hypothetical protein
VKQLGTRVTIVIGVLLGLVSMSNAQDVDEAILQQKVTIKPNSPGYPGRNNFPHRWYNVKLTANKTYQIDLMAVDAIDPYLFIELDGQVLAQDDDGGGNLNSRIIFRPTRTAEYKIIATTFNGAAGEAVLVVQPSKNVVAGPGPKDPVRPNPGGGLGKVGPPIYQQDGFLAMPGQEKTHQVQLQRGKTYQIDCLSTDGRFDPVIELNGPNNRFLASDDDSGGFPHARIIYQAEADGMYTIVVAGFNNSTGQYRLIVSPR